MRCRCAEPSRWAVLVGEPESGNPPADPFLREAVEPRSPSDPNPVTGATLGVADPSTNNPINGHDYLTSDRSDLQYACTDPLALPQECAENRDCPCHDGEPLSICRDPATGDYGTTRFWARAYPATRQLQVLRGLGEQAVVASICAKVLDRTQPDYGYNPAVQALVDRLGSARKGACLPRELAVDPERSTVPCRVIEAMPPARDGSFVDRSGPGRVPADPDLHQAVIGELRTGGTCDQSPRPACEDMVLCSVLPAQVEGPEARRSCENDDPAMANGFCYVDAPRGIGNPELVADCPETSRRMVRVVSADPVRNPLPRKGATVYHACAGRTLDPAAAP